MPRRKGSGAHGDKSPFTSWSRAAPLPCARAAMCQRHSHLRFESGTDREAALENLPLNLPPEMGHKLQRDPMQLMKDKPWVFEKFLLNTMKMLIIAKDFFLKNVIAEDQRGKFQNDSCNLPQSLMSSFNLPWRKLLLG